MSPVSKRWIRMQRNRSRTALGLSWIICVALGFAGYIFWGTLVALFAGLTWTMANERLDELEEAI